MVGPCVGSTHGRTLKWERTKWDTRQGDYKMAPNIRMSVWVRVGVRIALLINLFLLSKNLVVYYCRCCNVICYAAIYSSTIDIQ